MCDAADILRPVSSFQRGPPLQRQPKNALTKRGAGGEGGDDSLPLGAKRKEGKKTRDAVSSISLLLPTPTCSAQGRHTDCDCSGALPPPPAQKRHCLQRRVPCLPVGEEKQVGSLSLSAGAPRRERERERARGYCGKKEGLGRKRGWAVPGLMGRTSTPTMENNKRMDWLEFSSPVNSFSMASFFAPLLKLFMLTCSRKKVCDVSGTCRPEPENGWSRQLLGREGEKREKEKKNSAHRNHSAPLLNVRYTTVGIADQSVFHVPHNLISSTV